MQKIIKITGSEAVVGNTEDNSFKRVPLANCYEGMIVDEIVDLFFDGSEYFIIKKDLSVSSRTSGGGFTNSNGETIADQGRKLFTQLASSLKEKTQSSDESSNTKEATGNNPSASGKMDGSWFANQSSRLFKQFTNDLKEKDAWLGAAIFLAILFVTSFLISVVLKDMVSNTINTYVGNYVDFSLVSINPLLIMGEIMFAGFKMSASAFGFSMSASFELPIILLSIIVIVVGIFSVKIFHNSKARNMPKPKLLRKVMTSVLAAFIVVLAISLFFSQSFNGMKLQLDIMPMLFKGLFVLVILTIAIVSGLKLNDRSSASLLSSHVLRHFYIAQIMGLVMALIVLLKVGFNQSVILLGNLSTWFTYALLGGQLSMSMPGTTKQNLLNTFIPGSSNWIWIIIIIVAATLVIDLDDLKAKLPKMPDWQLSLIFSGVITVLLTITAMLGNIAVKASELNQVGGIGADFGSSIIVFLLLFAAGFVRLAYLDKLPVVENIKQIWLKLTLANSKRS